ncbi:MULTISPECIES: hypothetical protein [Actinomyces]|uniref:Uncharacterized protein n=1 Tax=Actinomyces respiraculi TaxID=2744574 RepID=A0A7T0PVY4_9ACTO|nr:MULTISPECIES: hypothetical protein [Actinomyces]QPL04928.1 hypothetical protein ID810_09270 [Actinomyces respiraculi]
MTSVCPSCFNALPDDTISYRCATPTCEPQPNQSASEYAGTSVMTRPTFTRMRSSSDEPLPQSVPCRGCRRPATQEVCPTCCYDLPAGWRQATVFTIAVTGARGAGKSVYIAVALQQLMRYAQKRECTLRPYTQGTIDNYNKYYYHPLYQQNMVVDGTPEVSSGGSYQKDPLIWQLSGQHIGTVFVVIRDVAGEDVERIAGNPKHFAYLSQADLLIFLFDPMQLDSIKQLLSGVIPDPDESRLGLPADQVLAKVLGQVGGGHTPLALTISKFDTLHQVTKVRSPLAQAFANPGARLNQDDTMARQHLSPADAAKDLERDLQLLDAELSSIYQILGQDSVAVQATQAAESGQVAATRRFAVSAIGETPQHANQLTERGISPFRALDPILWGLSRKDIRL